MLVAVRYMVLGVDHILFFVLVLGPHCNFQMAAFITPNLCIRKLRPERLSKLPMVTWQPC